MSHDLQEIKAINKGTLTTSLRILYGNGGKCSKPNLQSAIFYVGPCCVFILEHFLQNELNSKLEAQRYKFEA